MKVCNVRTNNQDPAYVPSIAGQIVFLGWISANLFYSTRFFFSRPSESSPPTLNLHFQLRTQLAKTVLNPSRPSSSSSSSSASSSSYSSSVLPQAREFLQPFSSSPSELSLSSFLHLPYPSSSIPIFSGLFLPTRNIHLVTTRLGGNAKIFVGSRVLSALE